MLEGNVRGKERGKKIADVRVKCKRPNDISQRVPDERPRGHGRFLGVACDVGCPHCDTLDPG
jgi:hypothetical protein